MGSIIFTSVEALLIGAGVYLVPFLTLVFMTGISLGYFWFALKMRKAVYFAVPILLLIRIGFAVNFNEPEPYEFLKIETNIVNSRGRAEKINGRFPLETINIVTEKIPDGKYTLYGEMNKISERGNLYEIDVKRAEEIPLNKIEIFFNKKLESLRENISNRCGNFLQGVILGERRYIYKNIRDKFIYCGSAHLLAISGLHVGAVIGIILWIVNLFKIKREVRYTLAFILLTAYVYGINISPSVVRAYIMGAVFLAGKIFYEKTDIKKSLALAVIINLFVYPNSLGNISFIMSYLCLFSIVYIYPKCRIKGDRKYKNILDFFIFTGVIQIFILPAAIYFFGTVPFLSYFTNFFLTPMGMVFVVLGFVSFFIPKIIFVWLVSPLLQLTYKILELMLNVFSRIPFLTIRLEHNLSLKFILFIYIILIVLFYMREIRGLFAGRKNENSWKRMCD